MYKASQTLRTLEFLISKVWSVHELGKNFQRRGRMRGEQSLLEREMLLEQWAGSKESGPLSRATSQFLQPQDKIPAGTVALGDWLGCYRVGILPNKGSESWLG